MDPRINPLSGSVPQMPVPPSTEKPLRLAKRLIEQLNWPKCEIEQTPIKVPRTNDGMEEIFFTASRIEQVEAHLMEGAMEITHVAAALTQRSFFEKLAALPVAQQEIVLLDLWHRDEKDPDLKRELAKLKRQLACDSPFDALPPSLELPGRELEEGLARGFSLIDQPTPLDELEIFLDLVASKDLLHSPRVIAFLGKYVRATTLFSQTFNARLRQAVFCDTIASHQALIRAIDHWIQEGNIRDLELKFLFFALGAAQGYPGAWRNLYRMCEGATANELRHILVSLSKLIKHEAFNSHLRNLVVQGIENWHHTASVETLITWIVEGVAIFQRCSQICPLKTQELQKFIEQIVSSPLHEVTSSKGAAAVLRNLTFLVEDIASKEHLPENVLGAMQTLLSKIDTWDESFDIWPQFKDFPCLWHQIETSRLQRLACTSPSFLLDALYGMDNFALPLEEQEFLLALPQTDWVIKAVVARLASPSIPPEAILKELDALFTANKFQPTLPEMMAIYLICQKGDAAKQILKKHFMTFMQWWLWGFELDFLNDFRLQMRAKVFHNLILIQLPEILQGVDITQKRIREYLPNFILNIYTYESIPYSLADNLLKVKYLALLASVNQDVLPGESLVVVEIFNTTEGSITAEEFDDFQAHLLVLKEANWLNEPEEWDELLGKLMSLQH